MAIKIGIIGIGNVAVENYLPYLAAQPDVALGCFNRTPEKAAAAAAKFGGQAFKTVPELIAWDPDTVLVLTNETTRYAAATELVRLGARRLFLEKPLVAEKGQAHVEESDFEKAKSLLAQAAEKKCETAMMFNYRFFEQSRQAKKIVAERKFGPVIQVMALVHYACWSHCIDLIHFFAGNIEEISAVEGKRVHSGAGIDAADDVAAFRLENGGDGSLIGTSGMKWQHPLFELIFTFENGRIHMRDVDGTLEILDGAGNFHETRSFDRDGSRWTRYGESFKKALEAYLLSLKKGTPPPVPGLDGLRELQVEAALKRSIRERRPVNLAQEFPL